MDTRTYTWIDKTAWGPGPWMDEPDKVQWEDAATGLPCLAVRGPLGNWCGYVGLADGHPAYRQSHERMDVEVHGGLTYSASCATETDESHSICHVPSAGEAEARWWLGFDTAHLGDYAPAMHGRLPAWLRGTYRTLAYVQEECRHLARQLTTGVSHTQAEKD
jgi:hypothetical protein